MNELAKWAIIIVGGVLFFGWWFWTTNWFLFLNGFLRYVPLTISGTSGQKHV